MASADGQQWHKSLADAADLGGVFLIGELKLLESAGGIYKITRVYAHFLAD